MILFNWGSGPYAVLIGASLSEIHVSLVGFDLYGTNNHLNKQHYAEY